MSRFTTKATGREMKVWITVQIAPRTAPLCSPSRVWGPAQSGSRPEQTA